MRHRFVYDEAYAVTADRYVQRTARSSWILRWLGIPLFLVIVVTSVAMREWKFAAVAALVAFFQLLAKPLHRRAVSRAARTQPTFGREIDQRWSDAGSDVRSHVGASTSSWASFTKAVLFEEGVVLFEGPSLARWLPDAALVGGSRAEFEALVRRHVADVVDARR